MAHSYVTFGTSSVLMHDIEIVVTVCYLLHVARQHPLEFPEADYPYLALWWEAEECYMPGCLDLELDRHLATAAEQARLRRLADAARAELEAEGDEVSGALLTRIVNAPGVFPILGNRPKAKLLADLDKLIGVLDGTTASS